MYAVHAVRETGASLYVVDDEGTELGQATVGSGLDEQLQTLGYARLGEQEREQPDADATVEVAIIRGPGQEKAPRTRPARGAAGSAGRGCPPLGVRRTSDRVVINTGCVDLRGASFDRRRCRAHSPLWCEADPVHAPVLCTAPEGSPLTRGHRLLRDGQ
ncbi:hypothetical protein DFQ14_101276 [Halopolyspora algeriensis]|uniref:Uncharacterized protein n=1 Tax=Halopolyspora algeriensis TaxID=1500506 RepID=A0A368VXL0_9ACTN|nr:hypothetical protein DFQ14_101276 [Halopolyspora algeriensis]TQM48027.1 hypothetical protein FHU43_2979 [Halopolyspora algeriensis]